MATRKEKKVEKVLRQPRKVFGDNPLARREHKEPYPLAELFNRQEVQPLNQEGEIPSSQNQSDLSQETRPKIEPDGYPQVQTLVYPHQTVGTQVPTPSTLLGTQLPTDSNQQVPTGSNNMKPVGTHRYEGHRNPNERQLKFWINKDLAKEIQLFCVQHGLTIKEFFERVGTHAVKRLVYPLSESFSDVVGTKVPHDDMMIFKTHEDIIMRFERYTNRKWTRRDDREGVRYNDTDIRLIEIAFIATVDKKLLGNTAKQPIKSFNYFTTEIDALIQQQRDKELPANLDEYHKYVLSTWEKRIRKLRDSKWPQTA